jgi:CRISPR/Cas system-associated exonuclease Cas4 (RecB family)
MVYILATINVIVLLAVAFICGYAFAKGRLIVIERKVELTEEEREKIERAAKAQEEAIEKYNQMVNSLTGYVNGEVI